jgi:hypothetical protein
MFSIRRLCNKAGIARTPTSFAPPESAIATAILARPELLRAPVGAAAGGRPKNIPALCGDLVPAGDETFLFEIRFAAETLNIGLTGKFLPVFVICRGRAIRCRHGRVPHANHRDQDQARHRNCHGESPPTPGMRTPNFASLRHRSPASWRGSTNEGTPGGCAVPDITPTLRRALHVAMVGPPRQYGKNDQLI